VIKTSHKIEPYTPWFWASSELRTALSGRRTVAAAGRRCIDGPGPGTTNRRIRRDDESSIPAGGRAPDPESPGAHPSLPLMRVSMATISRRCAARRAHRLLLPRPDARSRRRQRRRQRRLMPQQRLGPHNAHRRPGHSISSVLAVSGQRSWLGWIVAGPPPTDGLSIRKNDHRRRGRPAGVAAAPVYASSSKRCRSTTTRYYTDRSLWLAYRRANRFLAGCRTRRLNQALSVFSLS